MRGPLYCSIAWLLVGLVVVLDPGSGQTRAVPAVLLAVSAATGSADAASALVFLAAAAAMIVARRGWPWRTVCLAAGLLAVIPSGLEGMTVLLVGLAVACVLNGRWLRAAVMGTFFLAGPVLIGLPASPEGPPDLLQENFIGDSTVWRDPVSLDYHRRAAELRTSGCSGKTLYLLVQAGGVRDALPLGTVTRGDHSCAVRSGWDTLAVPAGGGETRIRMDRSYRPFSHPVIHVTRAWTGGDDT